MIKKYNAGVPSIWDRSTPTMIFMTDDFGFVSYDSEIDTNRR